MIGFTQTAENDCVNWSFKPDIPHREEYFGEAYVFGFYIYCCTYPFL